MNVKTPTTGRLTASCCGCMVLAAAEHEHAQHVVLAELRGQRRGKCKPREFISGGQIMEEPTLEGRCLNLVRVVSGQHLGDCTRADGQE